MALALALTFILVLGGQSASASSIRQSISNGQQKSSREDHNSLSRNRRETWWWVTTKATIDKRNGYGRSCYITSECRWSGMVCESRQCVCPVLKQPNYYTKKCDYKDGGEDPLLEIKITGIFVGIFLLLVGLCRLSLYASNYRRSDRDDLSPQEVLRPYREAEARGSSTIDLPPVGVSALTNASSTLDLLDVQDDFPPDYTDVYMQAPQEKADELDNGLPTYGEVVERPEWNSQPVFVITPHSSAEKPWPQSFDAAGAFAPSAPVISPPWDERDSSLTLRTDDHKSQNYGYQVDSSESDGRTNHVYGTFD